MSISTSQQKVDQGQYNRGFDGTFRSRKSRPGKTVYVPRNGKIVEKESETFMFVMPANPHRSYFEEMDRLKNEVMRPYRLATVADLPHE